MRAAFFVQIDGRGGFHIRPFTRPEPIPVIYPNPAPLSAPPEPMFVLFSNVASMASMNVASMADMVSWVKN